MTQPNPYIPEGLYVIEETGHQAEVYYIDLNLSSEIRVAWLSDDDTHQILNNMFSAVSVLELDYVVQATMEGATFTVDPLEDLFPRPGWELVSQNTENPSHYTITQLDDGAQQQSARHDLLLLCELAIRSAIAPHIGQPPPRDWIQRLRAVHPLILKMLEGHALFHLVD